MLTTDILRAALKTALAATHAGPPALPSNPFFGVGPISDGSTDEVDRRLRRLEFEHWLHATYRKTDDRGNDIGGYTVSELARSMHRGEPADSILLDMMRSIHRYFGLPVLNRLAVGLGGGHSGFTTCIQHLMTLNDPDQQVYIDTPAPESDHNNPAGFFRQSWATQITDLCRLSRNGTTKRLHFSNNEGSIPSANTLEELGIRLFIGVGHETTGATSYTAAEVAGLLEWLARDPAGRHAIIDATSLLGAMPWPVNLISEVMAKCCLFMPLQKAIGGVSGYFTASFTPQALAQIERNIATPSWAIPRQLSLTVPQDPTRPLSSPRSIEQGPFYDAGTDRMTGGVINTFSLLAFAETTFGLRQIEQHIGPASALNARSTSNRAAVESWVADNPLFTFSVIDPEKRGTAVTLLQVNDPEFKELHARILTRAKQLLGQTGITHPNGRHEAGLGAALYLNAFPGMPGDFRAWIGGVRETADIHALLDNLHYAWLRAKVLVIAEELVARGEQVPDPVIPAHPIATVDTSLAESCAKLAAILGGIATSATPTQTELYARYATRVQELTHELQQLTYESSSTVSL
ncbi:hypothetical protein [Halomonas sp. AOP42-B2-16]|uniref:hypothetical protein n=1 Tax=Halomonas sp. AOP42-B2-16 TaxID=3457673 RepID=UPI0040348377